MKKPHIFPLIACIAVLSTGLNAQPVVDQKPEPVSTPLPILGTGLIEADGEVLVEVTINSFGYVTQATAKSTTNPDLVKPCLEAIRQWKYLPAKKDGKAVALTFLQPLRFGDFTISAEPHPATKPRVLHQEAPELPANLKPITGQVTLLLRLGTEGQILAASVHKSTHVELNDFALGAVRKWRFAPAMKEDKPMETSVYVPFQFFGTPPSEEEKPVETVDNADLVPERQAAPELPQSLQKADGEVEILLVVDKQGFVTQAEIKKTSSKELAELAKAAALEWKFRPVTKNGAAVSVRALQPFIFGKGVMAVEALDKVPRVTHSEAPSLPDGLKEASGSVTVLFELSAEGKVLKVEAKDASLPELKEPVLEAARHWKFTPATKKGAPVPSKVVVPIRVNL